MMIEARPDLLLSQGVENLDSSTLLSYFDYLPSDARNGHSRVAFLMGGVAASLRAPRPSEEAPAPATLGAHLMQRRRELGHRRVDAARIIGTSWKSLMWWERNEREPLDRFWPAIIGYLAHEPWREPTSLGDQLRAERRRRGLAIFEAAAAMGIDETTFWWWEGGRRAPRFPRTKALVELFLSGR
jgi:DNA-binding transcriptional regulator YiaG